MPWHVIEEAGRPSFLVEGSKALGESTEVTDLGDDVGVAVVAGVPARACGVQLGSMSRVVDDALARSPQVNVRTVLGDGTVSASPASVVDNDGERFLRLSPISQRMTIRKGQSGSLVMVGDRVVGQLLSVGARDGLGKALRVDDLLGRVSAHMRQRGGAAPNAQTARCSSCWKVTSWSAQAAGPEYSATNLTLDRPNPGWRVKPLSWPLTIELLSANGEIVTFEGVTLTGSAPQPGHHSSLRYQLLVSSSETGNDWRPIKNGGLDLSAPAQISFLPTRSRRLRVELFRDSSGQSEWVHLKSLNVR